MTYQAEISRDNPTCILFVIDESGSMSDTMPTGRSKADFVADVLNKTIYTLVTNCTKADGIRDYFDIGVIGYGGTDVRVGIGGNSSRQTQKISELSNAPLRVEDRTRLDDDGAGGVVERKVKFPVWFQPTSSGGTPMCAGLTKAAEILVEWCDANPHSYPPTILHVTDGEATDGSPDKVASALRQIGTDDGNCLVFNLHVSTRMGESSAFPSSPSGLADDYARVLFSMSSELPEHVARAASEKGYSIGQGARGFIFNGDPKDIVNFFDIGTRPRLTADR